MTVHPFDRPPSLPVNWATIGVLVAIAGQLVGAVALAVRIESDVAELRATTEPLRRGDLVKIENDVSWIRRQLEQER